MAISFEIPERIRQEREMLKAVAETAMRPLSREMDEQEHERPWPFINTMWPVTRDIRARALYKIKNDEQKPKSGEPGITNLRLICTVEQLSWGDVGLYLCMPDPGLAGYAIEAAGTKDQKIKFLERFAENEQPTWGAMAMTEPGAGSDTASIQTTATYDPDTNEYILNGEKIFCTNGKLALEESNGLVVIWATLDRSMGRAGMRPFVVEAGTPGVSISKVELKHGIRASDTAAIVLDNAHVPADNLLGDPAVKKLETGTSVSFRAAMGTFDASRPMVAASAIGVGRAALEFTKETLAKEGITIPYGKQRSQMTSLQSDLVEMEMQIKAAWLLTLRATSLLDHREPNSLEASMAKVKAGRAVTFVAQKAVELLGTMGYSRDYLVEKWMRDARINRIYEGTDQINLLIIARRILNYSSKDLS